MRKAVREAREMCWLPVDIHPLVLEGVMGRDALYRAARENRVRRIWVSSKRLLIHLDAIEDLMRAEKPE